MHTCAYVHTIVQVYKKALLRIHPDKHMHDFGAHVRATEVESTIISSWVHISNSSSICPLPFLPSGARACPRALVTRTHCLCRCPAGVQIFERELLCLSEQGTSREAIHCQRRSCEPWQPSRGARPTCGCEAKVATSMVALRADSQSQRSLIMCRAIASYYIPYYHACVLSECGVILNKNLQLPCRGRLLGGLVQLDTKRRT